MRVRLPCALDGVPVIEVNWKLPGLEVKMRIGCVFLTHRGDQVALVHLCTWNHTLRDAAEMKIDKEQVILAVCRIANLEMLVRTFNSVISRSNRQMFAHNPTYFYRAIIPQWLAGSRIKSLR